MAKAIAGLIEVTFGYADTVVLEQASLQLQLGSVAGLLGRNGSGKTTTMRLLVGILEPLRGQVVRHAARVGYLPEERGLYRKTTVRTYLEFLARLEGLVGAKARAVSSRWLERLDLTCYAETAIEMLSKGNQQKVQLAASLIGEPELLLWDEPFSGLDPVNRDLMLDVLEEQRRVGTSVLLSTHRIADLEELADVVYILSGRHFHKVDRPRAVEVYELELQRGTQGAQTQSVPRHELPAALAAALDRGDTVLKVRPQQDLGRIFQTLAAKEEESYGAP